MALLAELIDDLKFMFSYRRKLMGPQLALNREAPQEGDLAPDFTLSDISGEKSVTLSDFRGKKPVALVFGSFT